MYHVEKGTNYIISGDNITIDPEGYEYDLLDRLIKVKKNGLTAAEYTYNYKGLRLKKENFNTVKYYVFGLDDNVLYEEENGQYSEYIYVAGQHFARNDGNLLNDEITTYFYHSDIALEIYGNEAAAEALANMNVLEDKNIIYEGQNLLLLGVVYDSSNGTFMQPGFIDEVRTTPDVFIASTIMGTVVLEAGALETVTTLGSSAYSTADKAFEKSYYWMSGKLARLQNVVSDKIGRLFNKRMTKLNFKVLKETPADEVNEWWLKEMGYTEPPYKPGTLVQEIELAEKTTFVRVFDGVHTNQAGGWIMKAENIAGLTPAQIQAKFALPHLPTQVTDVVLDVGTKIRTDIANDLFGHAGGGIQFDLMGQRIGEFINARPLN